MEVRFSLMNGEHSISKIRYREQDYDSILIVLA